MSNLHDFWGATKVKIKTPKKFVNPFRSEFFIKFKKRLLLIIPPIQGFFKRLKRLPKVLNRIDRIAILLLFLILLGLLGYKFNRDWLSKTKKEPTIGGAYKEVLIGEARYLNPILAKSDTDKTINRFIYSGLTTIDQSGQIAPDLAEKWEIAPDGKTYTFHLRAGVYWHDGEQFTATDVLSTIDAVKNQSIKSPYSDAWQDVTVESPDPNVVIFKLKDPYGPFIYSTLIGIMPAHINPESISSSPVGTGPYQFSKVVSGKNSKISEVVLKRNASYYRTAPYISEVDFQIAADENEAKKMFDAWGVSALAGIKIDDPEVANFSFPTSRYFGLVFNLRDDRFKDTGLRKKIQSTEKFDPQLAFTLLTLDRPISITAAQILQSDYEKRGIKITIDKKSAVDYQNLIEKRSFQAVLYGFDPGYDRDPYPFWHSSQIASGGNFAGFSDKAADILLEDARMTVDNAARNQKYDQFFQILSDNAAAIFLPHQEFVFSAREDVLGMDKISGLEPWDHLNSFANWYLKTKRVKP